MLRDKKEHECLEMRKALEAQIEEKRRRKEEEKQLRMQEDLKFERTVSVLAHGPDFQEQAAKTAVLSFPTAVDRASAVTAADKGENKAPPAEDIKSLVVPIQEEKPVVTTVDCAMAAAQKEEDDRMETLKSQLQALSQEKAVLLNEIEGKDKVINEMKLNRTRYVPPVRPPPMKHKVIASADCRKKAADRRRKEEQCAQIVSPIRSFGRRS